MPAVQEILCVKEVAQLAGIPAKAVYLAINVGDLKAYKFNARTLRVSRQAMDDWLKLCETRAAAPRITGWYK